MTLTRDKLIAVFPLALVIVYLCLGFFWDLWHPGWIIFLLIPAYYWISDAARKRTSLATIVSGAILLAYLALGIFWGLWHPGWIILLLIPIVWVLAGDGETGSGETGGAGKPAPAVDPDSDLRR